MSELVAVNTVGRLIWEGELIQTPVGIAKYMGVMSIKGCSVIAAHPVNKLHWTTFTPSQLGLNVEEIHVAELLEDRVLVTGELV